MECFQTTHLIIARAGASTISGIIFWKTFILIPIRNQYLIIKSLMQGYSNKAALSMG